MASRASLHVFDGVRIDNERSASSAILKEAGFWARVGRQQFIDGIADSGPMLPDGLLEDRQHDRIFIIE